MAKLKILKAKGLETLETTHKTQNSNIRQVLFETALQNQRIQTVTLKKKILVQSSNPYKIYYVANWHVAKNREQTTSL